MSYTFHGMRPPEHLQESIDAYVEQGRPTGDFLRAVIDNDLREAVGRADEHNMHIIPAIVAYLYNECPAECSGFKGAARRHIAAKCDEREKVRQSCQP